MRKGLELDVPLPTIDTCYRRIAGINQWACEERRTTRSAGHAAGQRRQVGSPAERQPYAMVHEVAGATR